MITGAEAAFNALPFSVRAAIARSVFDILEYDEEGNPGSEWSSDTLQALGDLFQANGVSFTPPTLD